MQLGVEFTGQFKGLPGNDGEIGLTEKDLQDGLGGAVHGDQVLKLAVVGSRGMFRQNTLQP